MNKYIINLVCPIVLLLANLFPAYEIVDDDVHEAEEHYIANNHDGL